MKLSQIVALVSIGAALLIFITAADDMSTYATFAEARSQGETVRVAGELVKERDIVYEPEVNPNYFSFYVRDKEGTEQQVILAAAKPQDFEMSEQIVVTGSMEDEAFIAHDMLMKCPSKYKDEEVFIRSKS